MSLYSASCRLDAQYKRRVRSKFDTLIKTPATGSVILPAGARFALRNTNALAVDTTALTIGSRTISVGPSAAGATNIVDFLPVGSNVQISSGFTLLLDNGLGVYLPIGSTA